ncbi:formylmethanofuran dehydrogenase subunit E family protein [Iningainema tapete]|uniref:Formylmethanofuran dehydrogenase subunit E family protein n=1 Tax=Iningainema tapete BLCC-T55 TaxID=2748662 RepID=A0A8J6XAD7_9CYAN|nr:formylmethanofuran dehydrogenase subunit E family protein [Iningainema tapete]MBD2770694.1 formylmethanofuran dehydrogenase subunit E family protein [Iningainema tapete BLCC-T55]
MTSSVSNAQTTEDTTSQQLERVEDIHGGAGPWAVVGYRMAKAALEILGFTAEVPHTNQERFQLYVAHYTPLSFSNGELGPYIQFTSMADGLHAGTGASIGKANLKICSLRGINNPTKDQLEFLASRVVKSVIVSRKPNQPQRCVQLRVTPNFAKNYINLPVEQLVAKGEEVMKLPDDQIFSIVELNKCPPPPPKECW